MRSLPWPWWLSIILMCGFGLLIRVNGGDGVESESIPLELDGLRHQRENGIVVLKDVNHILQILDNNEKRLMLAVLYLPSCSHSDPLIRRLEQAQQTLQDYLTESFPPPAMVEPPILAKLETTYKKNDSFLKSLGIDALPMLYFFRVVENELVVMDFMARTNAKDQNDETVKVLLHYWYRYAYGPIFALESMEQVQAFLEHNAPGGMLAPVTGGLHPDYTPQEQAIIQSLMDTPDDPFSIFIQCQSKQQHDTYKDMFNFCQLQSARRDVACFSIQECGQGLDGDVVSILLNPNNYTAMSSVRKPTIQPMHQFGIQRSTPTLLFFDRVSTAPIAFPLWRSLHAVLFVNLAKEQQSSKDAIAQLYKACLTQRLKEVASSDDDMVCLVVPDTETRVLTTFGVDIWTPLDQRVMKGTHVPELLPVLMITDKRGSPSNQLRRYYLDAPQIVQSKDHDAIDSFLRAFWNNSLQPECKSSNKPLRTNKYGVEILSGKTFQQAVVDRQTKHSLIYIYSPTCGHCKRFSILWNKLATLVRDVGWSDFLDIQQLDSTQNEVLEAFVDPAFVPAVYYFAPYQKTKPIYYADVDTFGNGAGRLEDPLDILDWFLDVANLDEGQLLAILEASP